MTNFHHLNCSPKVSSAFELLHPIVQKWIWHQGWDELHDIQEDAIKSILNNEHDIIISAATAKGKTEAAFLPICSALAQNQLNSVSALYISPLKALINDQFFRLTYLCKDLDIPVHSWHGDVASSKKRKLINHPSGILLITPESLEAFFVVHGTKLKTIFNNLSYVVVDELHAFIGNERGKQLQSLLHRLEILLNRRIQRIALSATLGDMSIAAEFLRTNESEETRLIESNDGAQEIRLQVRGYLISQINMKQNDNETDEETDDNTGDYISIAKHLFKTLRGTDNLIFCNSRQEVERYADLLRRFCKSEKLPNEFFPHHGCISKELREDVEDKLKVKSMPVNVICTSTLEMGIDIGNVTSIAQVSVPFSVASIRQRLGRSGRRDEPAILRMYIQEKELSKKLTIQDNLRPHLVQAVAMINLLIKKWYEPPEMNALHLSTLIQQVLSMIAQYGGISASNAWNCLCKTGPFAQVNQKMFALLLRGLGKSKIITQTTDGLLLLDIKGERLVNHYSFYAAFSTPEEYLLYDKGKRLGTLPVNYPLVEGMFLIFAGRRWRVISVDIQKKIIQLSPAKGGLPPRFLGGGGQVHDIIRKEMKRVYMSTQIPIYLNKEAHELLSEGRKFFFDYKLAETSVIKDGKNSLLFIWHGDCVLNTLVLLLRYVDLDVTRDDLAISVSNCSPEELKTILNQILKECPCDAYGLAAVVKNKWSEKYDQFLADSLLCENYASRFLNIDATLKALQECEDLYSGS
jgi:ATP-dependent Lhr-like helicase